MLRLINHLWRAILDLVYPRYCLICGGDLQATEHFYLCADCISRMEIINQSDICPKCGIYLGPNTGGIAGYLCRDCQIYPPRFDRARAAAKYQGLMRETILMFKYGRQKCLARDLGGFLAGAFDTLKDEPVDTIISVPLHKSRRHSRGFNQAELLARRVSNILKIPLMVDNLVKTKETPDQAGLDGPTRRENLKNAFTVKRPDETKDKSILLIDDVVTTGTTTSEISRILKNSKAKQVFVLSLAHGR